MVEQSGVGGPDDRPLIEEHEQLGVISPILLTNELLDDIAEPLVRALSSAPADFLEKYRFENFFPKAGRRYCIETGYMSPALAEAVEDLGLGYFRSSDLVPSWWELRTSVRIGAAFESSLRERLAARNNMSVAGIQTLPIPGSGAWRRGEFENFLFNADQLRPRRPSLGDAEMVAAILAIKIVMPANLSSIPLPKLIAFKSAHRTELTNFQNYLHQFLESSLGDILTQTEDLEELRQIIDVEYKRQLLPALQDLEEAMYSQGFSAAWGALSLRSVSGPALATALGHSLNVDGMGKILITGSGFALSYVDIWRQARKNLAQLRKESPQSYLLSLKKFESNSLVSQIRHMGRQQFK